MAHCNTIFHQMLKLIPRHYFARLETEPDRNSAHPETSKGKTVEIQGSCPHSHLAIIFPARRWPDWFQ